jgi:superfamily II DNA or RNA helicase
MALTLGGYQIAKKDIEHLHHTKGILTVKPHIPSVFVKPQFVKRYPVYKESEEFLYLPKHYGLETFGPFKSSTREVSQTDPKFWEFVGNIRDNQKEVVNSYLLPQPHDGVISLQTGGGKTVCALYIASQLKVPTIVLVHNTFLRDQWVERIKAFLPKARIGFVQGDQAQTENVEFVVAMLQTVSQRDYSSKTFKPIGLVIVDECHHIATESFSNAMTKLTSKYVLGLSATLDRKDGLMHVIHWFLGPLLYKSNTADKIDEGVKVEVYEFDPNDDEYNAVILNQSGVMFTSLMVNKVVEYKPRNEFLVKLLLDVSEEKERQLLVLTDRVDHAQTLFDMLPSEIQETACILGRKVKAEQRAEWCSTKRILLATYQMCKEGFDVATLNTLIIATSRPDVDQIVGRILRVDKAHRKIDPLIIDIVDPAFRRQFQQRLDLYKKRNYTVEKMELT